MGLFNAKKKFDPISDRARTLTAEIAALEAQIKKLDTKIQHVQAQPRLRSTALPHTGAVRAPSAAPREPAFEAVDHQRVKAQNEPETTPAHYNEPEVRGFDLTGAWK